MSPLAGGRSLGCSGHSGILVHMDEPFVGVRGKLTRAAAHLNLTARLIRQFVRDECGARPEHDVHAGVTNVIVRLPVPPQVISLAIGDAVHNMRAALDYLAFEIVSRNPHRPDGTPDLKTMFPICDTESGYRNQIDRVGRLRGMPDHAQLIVQRLQPYHLRLANKDHTLHPLWFLNRLENVDKHRRLALTTGVGFESYVQIRDAAGAERTVLSKERLHDGDVVARYSTPAEGQPVVEVDGAILAFVALNEPHELPALVGVDIASVLKQTLRYLREHVLPAFENDANTGGISATDHASPHSVDPHAGADRTTPPAASLRTFRRRKKA